MVGWRGAHAGTNAVGQVFGVKVRPKLAGLLNKSCVEPVTTLMFNDDLVRGEVLQCFVNRLVRKLVVLAN